MKGTKMTDWKTVQMFLSQDSFGIFEVEVKKDNTDVRCNCTTYNLQQSCKHSRFVRRRMDANQGRYATPIADHYDPNDPEFIKHINTQLKSHPSKASSLNREFVLRFGKVEVI